MLITNHVLSGALVGLVVDDPRTAAGAGVVSHLVLDLIPHYGVPDEHLMRIAVPDGLVGLATIAVLAAKTPRRRRLAVLAGIFGACVPDLDKPGKQFFGRSPFPAWLDRFHSKIQCESTRRFPVEVAAAAAFGAGLYRRLRSGSAPALTSPAARPARSPRPARRRPCPTTPARSSPGPENPPGRMHLS